MFELIQQLTEVYGPSGFEDRIREMIRSEIEEFADEISVDTMGNLIALKKGKGSDKKLKVMIAAHMDEIGVMASHITEEGFLRFANIGGVQAHSLQGGRVQFENGTIGVIYSDQSSERSKIQPLAKHYIDVGATGQADCPVNVGDAAGFLQTTFMQGTQRVVGKALDDRIGCVIAIEALKALQEKESAHDIYFVFSVQEEVGVRGATAAANAIQPDVGIALDVTLTGDMHKGVEMAVALGDGAAIKAKDSGMIAHVGLVNLMKKRAADAGIPFQIEVLAGGSTDARAMQLSGSGAAAGCISIPCRYVHSPSEVVDMEDVNACISLLSEILTNKIDL
ncbi:MAG: putative aminopeptidase FrvX [Cellvibrionaceae bacterium]|jgi:putative aminopeptidase FrvX